MCARRGCFSFEHFVGKALRCIVNLAFLAAVAMECSTAQGQCGPTQSFSPSDVELVDVFGISVSVHGDVALVGSVGADGPCGFACDVGAAYVYRFDGTYWLEEQKLTHSGGEDGDALVGQSQSLATSQSWGLIE